MIMMNTSVTTRARGYRRAYAPSTAAIAPLAPTVGMTDSESDSTWSPSAASPPSR